MSPASLQPYVPGTGRSRGLPRSPLSGVSSKEDSGRTKRLADGRRWKYTNQPGPHTHITGWEETGFGVTTYIIMTSFGDGPKVVVRHRYSDFLKLHELIGKGTEFPVPKALIVTDGVKK